VIKELRPRVVIHTAACSAVDDCEGRQEFACGVNGMGPGYVAETCAAVGATMVYFGSNYVFDGSRARASGVVAAAINRTAAGPGDRYFPGVSQGPGIFLTFFTGQYSINQVI
jgi:nucleoside-diphosphate-sugar epimerase